MSAMKLTLDIGNTRNKYVLWDGETVADIGEWESGPVSDILASRAVSIAWCSTRNDESPVPDNFTGFVFRMDHNVRLPFINAYKTPETLGRDRMAAVAGACRIFPGKNMLVVDAGTCITADFISADGIYMGGAISPGLEMRYRALHEFTGKLPLVHHREFETLLGTNTEESILSGVWQGILGELHYRIHEILKLHGDTSLLLTGGNGTLLANHLKYRIFAEPLLVHKGLLYCLELNEI